MKQLKINDNLIYEFNPDDSFTSQKDNKTYKYISLKRIITFNSKDIKTSKKYQTLTIKKENWELFKNWMLDILTEGSDF